MAIIRVMLPNMSIESPTATNVKASRVGFLILDLIVRPIVAGRLEVSFWILREDSLTSCCPRMTSKGWSLDACRAGKIPEIRTISIATPTICRINGVTSAALTIGIPRIFS